MKKHFNIRIFGKVQGIFYRATAKEEAEKLNITGFAKNESDGSVYIEAEGKKEKLNKFVKWCQFGPPLARVKRVLVTEGGLKNFLKFGVY